MIRLCRAVPTARLLLILTATAALLAAGPLRAEQMQRLGAYQAHYSVVPTLFLKADIADHYDIRRGQDRALLNISVLGADGMPVQADLAGRVTNLLNQAQPLAFREVTEGNAVYYLAELKHTDQEVLRFAVTVQTPDGATHQLEFQQKMYVQNP